ncbi:MAG: hypothetical protein J0M29_08830 [Chitinophagales bacterium]|nr:hypothetical protein [Chitinophagales bacterium]
MQNQAIKIIFLLCTIFVFPAQSQNLNKGYLEQGLEYYYATQQYDKALKALELLQKDYDLSSVRLDMAIHVAVKFKKAPLVAALLEQESHDFKLDLSASAAGVGEWLGDSTFRFQTFFGKKWPVVAKRLEVQKQGYEDNLKSDYYGFLLNMLNVDQFVRFNSVSAGTFKEVDSLNLDMLTAWLVELPAKDHIKSRLNNQMLVAMLRHLGPARFKTLSDNKVFTSLLAAGIISPQDYGMMYDYLHPMPAYFVKIDAFIEKNWSFSGIHTLEELKAVDQRRASIGLLPLQYSGYCVQRNIIVPANLTYAAPVDQLVFGKK